MKTLSDGDRIVSAKERRTMVPYSDMHIWRLERENKFPRRIRLGEARVGWSFQEIQAWIAARKAERDAELAEKVKAEQAEAEEAEAEQAKAEKTETEEAEAEATEAAC